MRRQRARLVVSSDSDFEPLTTLKEEKVEWSFHFDTENIPTERAPAVTIADPYELVYSKQEKVIQYENLVLHRKKIEQVSIWFEQFASRVRAGQGSVLLLTGPTGSGKTAIVRSLCHRESIPIIDGYEYQSQQKCARKKSTIQSAAYPSLKLVPDQADDHLDPESSYVSAPRILLVDDLPNEDASKCIEDILSIYETKGLQVIFIVTDPCSQQGLLDNLLVRRISRLPQVIHVQFNPVAPSFIKKLLGNSNYYTAPPIGDMRAAIIDSVFNSSGHRDSSYGIFHAVGKILYPRTRKEQIDVAALTENDRTQFHAFLHANYLKFISKFEHLAVVSTAFSLIDSVDWNIKMDYFWEANYSSLPELVINDIVNRQGSKPHKKGFQAIEGPFRIVQTTNNKSYCL
jgi:adenylate kinase family enzyme